MAYQKYSSNFTCFAYMEQLLALVPDLARTSLRESNSWHWDCHSKWWGAYLMQTYHIRTSKFDFRILQLHGELQISISPNWFFFASSILSMFFLIFPLKTINLLHEHDSYLPHARRHRQHCIFGHRIIIVSLFAHSSRIPARITSKFNSTSKHGTDLEFFVTSIVL